MLLCRLFLVAASGGSSVDVVLGLILLWGAGGRVHGIQWWRYTGLVAPWMWNPYGPGVKPVSSALAGGFSPTAPPGKSSLSMLMLMVLMFFELYVVVVVIVQSLSHV